MFQNKFETKLRLSTSMIKYKDQPRLLVIDSHRFKIGGTVRQHGKALTRVETATHDF